MEVIGKNVKHKIFGVGTIIEQDETHIRVEFRTKTTKFVYPDAFESFLVFEENDIQKIVLEELTHRKKENEEKKRAKELEKLAYVQAKEAQDKEEREAVAKKTGQKMKPTIRTNRENGKRVIFYVFQGDLFDKEYKGGYLWAPLFNKAGVREHHWERLLDVQAGDIILHGCNGYIQAISVVKGQCYDCLQPVELRTEESWDLAGRKVECEYTYIDKPIKTSIYKEDIRRLCVAKYSPFDKNGNGNIGYLYQINRELAHIFVEATVKDNEYLLSHEFIQQFLEEE